MKCIPFDCIVSMAAVATHQITHAAHPLDRLHLLLIMLVRLWSTFGTQVLIFYFLHITYCWTTHSNALYNFFWRAHYNDVGEHYFKSTCNMFVWHATKLCQNCIKGGVKRSWTSLILRFEWEAHLWVEFSERFRVPLCDMYSNIGDEYLYCSIICTHNSGDEYLYCCTVSSSLWWCSFIYLF
jgi:hypothetical protein